MSNLVTVNSGSAIDGSLKAGRVAISTDSTVNPSSGGKTWYNVINPAEGYVFITDPKVQGYNDGSPIIYPTQTSLPADILATINGLPDRRGSVPFDNVWDALSWLGHNGKYFLLDKTLNGTIAEGITMYMSPESLASYPQSGSTVYNLGGTTNGTLANGPIWSYNGYFDFDGTDDYLTLGSGAASLVQGKTAVTMGILFKLDATASLRGLIGTLNYGCGANLGLVASGTTLSFYNDYSSTCYSVSRTIVETGKWIFAVGTYDGTTTKIYGIKDGTMYTSSGGSKTGATNTFSSTFRVMGNHYSSYFTNGQCAQAFVYDRALSEDEIWDLYYKSPIVADSLVLALDASNLISYPKSGNVWDSLIGTDDAEFYNGPTYVDEFGGGISRDGIDDFITASISVPSTTTNFSVETWFKANPPSNTTYKCLVSAWSTSNGGAGGWEWQFYNGNLGLHPTYTVQYEPNTVAHAVYTQEGTTAKIYLNGVLQQTQTLTTDLRNGRIGIGSLSGPGYASYNLESTFYKTRVYNKTLTETEILQNYTAEYSQFKSSRDITKDGLVLDLDAGNPNSYLSGTIWTDLSGGGNNGTLTNSPTYSTDNGGVIRLDGTDDYVLNTWKAPAGNKSMNFWVKYNSLDAAGGNGYSLSGAQQVNAYFYTGIQDGGQGYSYAGNTGGTYNYYFNANQWYNVCTVMDNGTTRHYVNGVQVATRGYTVSNASTVNFPIGCVHNGSVYQHFFDADFGNMRVYNRVLGPEEVMSIYTSTSPRYQVQLPRSVTDSLVLDLDSGNTTSYPRTGTTWYDRSGKGNHATLTNNPTYLFENGGVISFDGTDDTANIGSTAGFNITNEMSVFAWVKLDSNSGWKGIFGGAVSGFVHFQLYNGGINVYVYGPNTPYANPDGVTIGTNVWNHIGFTFGNNTLKVYLNGEQLPTTVTGNGANISSNSDVRVGWAYATSRLMQGKIPSVKVYNKALSSSEVLENYKATRSRFGNSGIVTSDLVIHLDPSNVTSYQNPNTDIFDLQGNYNGSLINGIPFNPGNGGRLGFDGSNDRIDITGANYPEYTINLWFKIETTQTTFTTTGHRSFVGSNGFRFQWDDNNTTQGRGPFIDFNGGQGSLSGTTFSPDEWFNQWQMVTVSRTPGDVRLYWNGVKVNYNSSQGNDLQNMQIGYDSLSGIGGADPINRDGGVVYMGDFMVHNRQLTDAEVLQNYTALKNRFGKD